MTDSIVTIIAGPTASGKSKVALERADICNGVIINADSMQVYADLRVLTARPSDEHLNHVPHKLYGYIKDFCHNESVASWRKKAIHEIESCLQNGQSPIVVGGTGLYLKTLLEGMSPIPDPDPKIREDVRERALTEEGRQQNFDELTRHDPEATKRLSFGDTQRITRALEIILSTGKPLAYWQAQPGEPLAYSTHKILLDPKRDMVISRAESRLEKMFEQGAIEEVQALIQKDIPADSPLVKALGVREIMAYLQNEISHDEAFEKTLIATRQYIKRQQTWFRNQMNFDEVL